MNELTPAIKSSWAKLKWLLLALGLVLLYNAIFTDGFFRVELKEGRLYGSLIDIVDRAGPVMLLALGMSLVIATGGVDLSVGAIMAIVAATAAAILTRAQLGLAPALFAGLGVGLLAGLWNGLLVSLLGVQPIVATLILMVAGRGIAQLITDGQIITYTNPGFAFLGNGALLGFPINYTIVLISFLLLALLVRKSALGLFIEASGDNEKAAAFSGINTRLIKTFAYTASGFFAAIAGLLVTADIMAADANNAGLYLELDAILAVVLGGTALTGGRFYLFNSLIGALMIQTLTTTILTRGIPVEYTLVVKALVILLVCLVQSELFQRWTGQFFRRQPA